MCNEEILKHMEEDMTFRGLAKRTKKLTLCKSLTNTKVLTKENISPLEILKKVSGKDFNLCPVCRIGHLIRPSPA